MKKIVVLFIVAICSMFVAGNAFAEDSYRAEVGISYMDVDEDNGDEYNVPVISASYQFADVNTSGHPLAEAAFLERIGNVEVSVGEGDVESSGSEYDVSTLGINFIYMQPDSPYAIGLEYFDIDIDVPGTEFSTETINFILGYFLADGLRVNLEYGQSEATVGASETDADHYAFNAKYVLEDDKGEAFGLEGGILKVEIDNSADDSYLEGYISVDHYFNERFNIGLGFAVSAGDVSSAEGHTVLVNARNFFTPNVYGEVGYADFSPTNPDGFDEETWEFSLTARF